MALAAGPACATPGAQGAGGTLASVVNTYYPVTASLAAGATSVPVGTPTGSATAIAAGDMLLVVQVQGATLNTTNTNNYGAGDGTGRGATAITAGTYEYVRAATAVASGSVILVGSLGGGLVNSYSDAGSSRVEIIRVPQYSTATLGSTLTASAWNGSSGGILALDVSGSLALGGATVSLNGLGFRGGLQRKSNGVGTGTTFASTDYVTKAASAVNGEKAEGYAGTPSIPTSTTADGYTGGDFARGAPGNAGGGGTDGNPAANDQNSGGGGGGNGGIGGVGGNSWQSNLAVGGIGGGAFTATASSVVLGGGGGAGTNNDGTNSSTGAPGGGLVLIRAGSTSGTGTITANGANAPGDTTNDGGGGGGAGGSIVVTTPAGGSLTGLTATANGGTGGVANSANKDPHGPGGGGAGGVVITSSAVATETSAGGANGTSVSAAGATIPYGATSGSNGVASTTATAASITGSYSGAECTASIAGLVFGDTDASGAVNGTEAQVGTGGQTVTLTNGSGNVVATTTAGANGAYSFPNVPSGVALTVTVTRPANYVVSSTEPLTVTVPANSTTTGVNIGLYSPAPLTSSTAAGVAGTVTPTKTTPNGTLQLLKGGTSVPSYTVDGQGTYSTDGTKLTFTPAAGFSGTATPATYQVTNAKSETATSTYTPTITPLAVTDPFSAPASLTGAVTLTVAASATTGVLANDLGSGLMVSGVDGTTALSGATSAGGTVTLTSAGGVSYAPKAGFSGSDTFSYTIKDGSGQTSTVTDTVTVAPVAVNGSVTVVDGSTTSGAAVPTPVGTAGSFTYAVVAGPMDAAATNGFTFNTATGAFTYTPKTPFSGSGTSSDFFTYTVTDKTTGKSSTATETLVVKPLAVTEAFTAPASATGAAVTTSPATAVVANDLGSGLTVTTTAPIATSAGGMVTLTAAGAVSSYMPKAGFSGVDTFAYTIQDGSAQTSTVTDTILVAPVAVTDAFTAPASATAGTVVVTSPATAVLANDVGTGLSVTTLGPITTSAGGTVTLTAAGVVSYAPPAKFSGTDTFPYTIKDGSGSGRTSTVTDTITVSPTALDDTPSVVDGSTLSKTVPTPVGLGGAGGFVYTLVSGPADNNGAFSLNPTTGAYSYTPIVPFTGTDTFTYTVTGAGGKSNTATVTITVTKPAAPTAVPESFSTSDQLQSPGSSLGQPRTVQVTGNDTGKVGTVNAVVVTQPKNGTAVVSTDGQSITYTPNAGFSGSDPFTYADSDGFKQTGTAVTEPVNVTPYAVNDAISTVFPNPVTAATSTLSSNDEGSTLSVTAIDASSTDGGTIAFNKGAGTYTYTPPAAFPAGGVDTFGYTVTDSSNQTSTAVVTVTLTKPTAPTAAPHAENTVVNTPLAVPPAKNLLTGSTGTKVTVVAQPAGTPTTAGGTVNVNTDGTYTYTPKTGFTGTDTFPYTVKDNAGQTASNTVTITVAPMANPDTRTVTYTNNTPIFAGAVPTPTGLPSANGFSYAVVAQPGHAAPNGFTFNSDGTYSYSPAAPFVGTDTFTYTVTGAGGTSAPAKITLNVQAPAAPTAVTDALTASAKAPLVAGPAVNVVGNDMVPYGPVTPTVVMQGAHGTVTLAADGQSFVYTPTASTYSGTDTFTYDDVNKFGNGAAVTDTVTITPFANADTIAAPFPSAKTFPNSTLTSNDNGSTLTVTGVDATTADGGKVALNSDGTFTYSPPTTYPKSGSDSFNYTLMGDGGTSTATVTVTLTPVKPVATNDIAPSTPSGTQLTVAAPGLLGTAGTPNADTGAGIVPSRVTDGAHGTATVNSDGSYTYLAPTTYSGPDSFTYLDTDVAGQTSNIATVSVTVLPVGNADNPPQTAYVTPETFSLTGNDYGSSDTITGISQPPAGGSVMISADKTSVTYTPYPGTTGADEFFYTGKDGTGQTYGPVRVIVTVAAPGLPVANDDNPTVKTPGTTTTAATATTIPVTANDSGAATLIPHIAGHTANGTPVVNADDTVTYTPVFGFSGIDTFTYYVTDPARQTSNTATVTVDVTPTGVADSYPTDYVTPVRFDPTTNDDASGPQVTSFTQPTDGKGTVTPNSDGTLTYTPNAGATGVDTFTYTAQDGSKQPYGPVTVTVTVNPPTAPQAGNYNEPTTANTALTQPKAANLLSKSSGTNITVVPAAKTATAHGSVVVNADGSYTYTPATGYSGPDSFTYTVKDEAGQPAVGTVSLTVTPTAADDPITVANSSPGYTANTTTLLGNDVGSGLTVTAVSAKSTEGGSVTLNAGGTYTYVPLAGYTGTDSFTYTDTDKPTGQTVQANVVVTVLPPRPVAVDDDYTSTAGATLTVPASGVLGNDTGAGSLSVTAGSTSATTAGGTVAGGVKVDGSFAYTPPSATFSGTDTFTYTTTGAGGVSAKATVTVTVKPFAPNDNQSVITGTTLTAATPKGVGSGKLTYTLVTGPTHGTGTFAVDPATGAYSYTPDPSYTGTDTFTYTVTDGNSLVSAAGTVTIAIGKPSAPVTKDDVNVAVSGGNSDPVPSVLSNDTGDVLGVPAGNYTQPAAGQGSVVMATDGTYTYTAPSTFSGTTTFTYTPVDATGQAALKPGTVTITVSPVAKPYSFTTAEDTAKTVTLPTPAGTGPFTYTVTGKPTGTLVQNPAGTFTYTPAPGSTADDGFIYTVTSGGLTSKPATVSIGIGKAPAPIAVADTYPVTSGSTTTFDAPGVLVNDKGDQITPNFPAKTAQGGTITPTSGGGFTYTAPAGKFSGTDTFPYTVTDINGTISPAVTDTITVSPVAVADPVTLTGGAPYASTTSILTNDLGSKLTVVAGSVTMPAHGIVTVNSDGTFTYTPDKGFFGTDSFSYENQDGSNPALVSQPATVTLTVLEPAGPVGKDDVLPVVANSGPVAAPQSLLSNDSGVGLTIKSYTQPTAGGQLTLDPATGNYSYTPPTGFSGTGTFTYVPIDEFGQTGSPVTVTITVAPVAKADSQTVRSGSTLSAAVPAPIGTAPLSYAVTAQPSHGTLTLNPTTGAYTYIPAANYLGADSFAYTVTGAGGTSLPASVSINVIKPVPPAGVASSGTTAADKPVTGSLTGSVSGFSPLTFAVAGAPAHGAVTVSPTGSYTYTPAPGFSGTDSFTYTVTDAFGQVSAPITVTETVTPTASADAASTPEGTPLTGTSVLANDAGTGLTAVLVSKPVHSTVTLNPNGTYTYTPTAGYAGPDSFAYVAKDGAGNASPAVAVSITVVPGTPVIIGGTSQTVAFGGTPAPITFTGPAGSTETVTTSNPGSLPPGLKLGPTGSFTGTATKAGTYTFPVTVTDPAGGTTTKDVTIVVKAAPAQAVAPVATTITVGDVLKLPNLGGTITKVTGTLPPGIKVLGTTLVGTGTKPGKYTVTVTISVHGKTITRRVTITVKPRPAVKPTQPTKPLSFTGAQVSMLLGWALALLALGLGLVGFAATRTRRRRSL